MLPQEAEEAQAPVANSRQAFMERIKTRHPELDENDEEGFYSAVNADYDEDEEGREVLKKYREEDSRLRDIFANDPRMANIFLGMSRGENVLEYLLDNFGQDFLDAINDPENDEARERIAQKQREWLERQSQSRELEKKAADNLDKALDAFEAVAAEMGADETAQEEAFKRFIDFQKRAIINDIDEEMWKLFFKGVNYDSDVEQAGLEGEVRGRNARIRERLRDSGNASPMGIGGAAASAPETEN